MSSMKLQISFETMILSDNLEKDNGPELPTISRDSNKNSKLHTICALANIVLLLFCATYL